MNELIDIARPSPAVRLCVGVSVTDHGATIVMMQPHADGSATLVYSETHPLGDTSSILAFDAELRAVPVVGQLSDKQIAKIRPDEGWPAGEQEAFRLGVQAILAAAKNGGTA